MHYIKIKMKLISPNLPQIPQVTTYPLSLYGTAGLKVSV